MVFIDIVLMETIRKETKTRNRIELGYKAALLIREVNARLNAAISEELAETGLTLPQITLIKALAHGKELTITELARELSTGKSTVVGIVDRLERIGLLERRRGGEDRREVHIVFALKAKDRLMTIKATVDATFSKAFKRIPAAELAEFERSLERILDSMGGAGDSIAGASITDDANADDAISGTSITGATNGAPTKNIETEAAARVSKGY
jgi:MarR family transcriptional regulator, organic hydroperoxide resistance regulator